MPPTFRVSLFTGSSLSHFLLLPAVDRSFEKYVVMWRCNFLPSARNPTREELYSRQNPDACNALKVEFVAMKNNGDYIPLTRGAAGVAVVLRALPRDGSRAPWGDPHREHDCPASCSSGFVTGWKWTICAINLLFVDVFKIEWNNSLHLSQAAAAVILLLSWCTGGEMTLSADTEVRLLVHLDMFGIWGVRALLTCADGVEAALLELRPKKSQP